MDAHLATSSAYRAEPVSDSLSRLARQTLAVGAGLVLLLCVVVVIRGSIGAFEVSAHAIFLLLTAVISELFAFGYRVVWSRLHPAAARRSILFAKLAMPSFCLVCIALALSVAAAQGWMIACVWLIVASTELAWWYPGFHRSIPHRRPERVEALGPGNAVNEADVVQLITRSRNGEGVEVVSGILRTDFASGALMHNLHVAFCPPLAYEPQVTAHQVNGPPLNIKVAQSEVFGARIELRLAKPANAIERSSIHFEVQPRGPNTHNFETQDRATLAAEIATGPN